MRGRPATRILLTFVVCYPMFLLAWLHIQQYYAAILARAAAALIPYFQEVTYEKLTWSKDATIVDFRFHVYGSRMNTAQVTISASHYLFNVPLTLAFLAAFAAFTRKKTQAAMSVLGILGAVHFIHVTLIENASINAALMQDGFQTGSPVWLYLRTFTYSFVDMLGMRFMPFLLGFNLLARSSIFNDVIQASRRQ